MKKLIRLELDRFSLKPHFIGLALANGIILILCIFTSAFLSAAEDLLSATGLPEVQLDTITVAMILVRATLIIWEAVLIAQLVIEEYNKKTIDLLYTYPVHRVNLIFAKLILISVIMLFFHIVSSVFQNGLIFLLSGQISFITYSFEALHEQILIALSTVFLSFLPLTIGVIRKSSIATIVSSIIIVTIAANSQGGTAGLLSIPLIAIIMGLIGAVITAITVKKMIASDLYN
jgi:ABC-type transport system involved in multi-copper enzyme maturation permease subunit